MRLRSKRSRDSEEWLRVVYSQADSPRLYPGNRIPPLPSDELQLRTTGMSGMDTLREASTFHRDCLGLFRSARAKVSGGDRLLDFGVGWGRIARFFLSDFDIDNIYGIDVMSEFVEVCTNSFESPNFTVTKPLPPSEFPDGFFKFIVGYSVFSHLSEPACHAWMKEFSRILVPGGVVVVTTRGRPFFDYCESLQRQDVVGYQAALGGLFPDFDEARERYDQGELVHSNAPGTEGGDAMSSQFYGETFIPQAYARTAFADHLEFIDFQSEGSRRTHPNLAFRKALR